MLRIQPKLRVSPSNHLSVFAFTILFLAVCHLPIMGQQTINWSANFNPSTIGVKSSTQLEFDLTNATSSPIEGLNFGATLPSGVLFSAIDESNSTCQGDLSIDPTNTSISFSNGRLGANKSCKLALVVTGDSAGSYTGTTTSLSYNGGSSPSIVTSVLTVDANRPGFFKSINPDLVSFGSRTRLTYTIDNSSSANSASLIAFKETLPNGFKVAVPSNISSSCDNVSISAPANGQDIIISSQANFTPQLVAGATCEVSLDIVASQIGTTTLISNNLTTTSSPFGGTPIESGITVEDITVSSPGKITMTKEFIDDPIAPGGAGVLRYKLVNIDRQAHANNITFSDSLSAIISGLMATNSSINDVCGVGSVLTGSSTILLAGASLPVDGTCSFDVPFSVPNSANTGIYVSTSSDISSEINGDINISTGATDKLNVESTPLLSQSYLTNPATVGSQSQLEFVLYNTSSNFSAEEITFQTVLPDIIAGANTAVADGFCGLNSTFVFTPIGQFNEASILASNMSIAPGDSCIFSIGLDIASDAPNGIYENSTSGFTGVVNGVNLEGKTVDDQLAIVTAPSLSLSFNNDPIRPGANVEMQFDLELNENVAGPASNVSFSTVLSDIVSGIQYGTLLSNTCGGLLISPDADSIFYSGGTLPAGTSCSITIELTSSDTILSGTYNAISSEVSADINGTTVFSSPGEDELKFSSLELEKEFLTNPTNPGDTVSLKYILKNFSTTETAENITINDNYQNALSGLIGDGVALTGICGDADLIWIGNNQVFFQKDELLAGDSCEFIIDLIIPASAEPAVYTSTTESFSASFDNAPLNLNNVSTNLVVEEPYDFLTLTTSFGPDLVLPGDTTTISYTLTNTNLIDVTGISFVDELNVSIPGATFIGISDANSCNSSLGLTYNSGELQLNSGSLSSESSCTFTATVLIGTGVTPALYTGITGPLHYQINTTDVTTIGTQADIDVYYLRSIFTKKTNGLIVSNSPGPQLVSGQNVQWSYELFNSQGDTIYNIQIIDNMEGSVTCPETFVEPGATMICTIDGIVEPGPYANRATLTAEILGLSFSYESESFYTGTCQPLLSCPDSIIVSSELGMCGATVTYDTPYDLSSCDTTVISLISGLPSGSFFPVGSTVVSYAISDTLGTTDTCSFLIRVNDLEAPTMSCPTGVTINTDTGLCSASNVNLGSPTATDNCSININFANNSTGTFNIGINEVLWVATDEYGNSDSCTQIVTVIDAEAPSIACPADLTINTDTGLCSASNVNLGNPTATDNCSNNINFANNNTGTFNIGINEVLWVATDEYGNSDSCTQIVTVIDAEAPSMVCPADLTINTDIGLCSASNVNLGSPTATDNCSNNINFANNSYGTFNIGINEVLWVATDEYGNSDSCTQVVTVIDAEAPSMVCPAHLTINTDTGLCLASNVNLGSPTATDNCSNNINFANNSTGTFNIGINQVLWVATDEYGNSDSCTQIVTVIDAEAPSMVCPADLTINTDAGLCSASNVNLGSPTATDNCSNNINFANNSTGTFNIGINEVLWIATDEYGNSDSCIQLVTVEDGEAPIVDTYDNISIWPPNGQYVNYDMTDFISSVSDLCSPTSISDAVILYATSDEAENGSGDGNTINDIVISADCKSIQLRRERKGNGNGRVYTVHISVSDASQNETLVQFQVSIPESKKANAIDDGAVYSESCLNGGNIAPIIKTELNTASHITKVTVVPNPADQFITLAIPKNGATYENISIYNILGEVVWTKENSLKSLNTIDIDVTQFDNGMYYILIQGEKQHLSTTFIKL